MKSEKLLTITSLVAIVLASLHLADDVVRGLEPRGLVNMRPIAMLLLWLVATLLLEKRLLRYVILILGSLLAIVMPIAHFRGRGIGIEIVASDGGYLFVWTLYALGVTGMFLLMLSLDGLWSLRRGKAAAEPPSQTTS